MDDLIQKKLDSQTLSTTDISTLESYIQECDNLLNNIDTHERMINQFAQRVSSRCLSSHSQEKMKVIERMHLLEEKKLEQQLKVWVDQEGGSAATAARKSLRLLKVMQQH